MPRGGGLRSGPVKERMAYGAGSLYLSRLSSDRSDQLKAQDCRRQKSLGSGDVHAWRLHDLFRSRDVFRSPCMTAAFSGTPSSPAVSRRMSRAATRNTGPERALRSELHKRGYRFRLHRALPFDARRKADLVFPKERLAVFVDGCFWHSCPVHGTMPRANRDFWEPKLARNRERDQDTDARLREHGWAVVRVWEHEPAIHAADVVESTLRSLRATPSR